MLAGGLLELNGLIGSVRHYVQVKLRQSSMLLPLQKPELFLEALADATQLQ